MSVIETSTKSKYFLVFILSLIGLGFALSTCDNIKRPVNSTNVASVNGVEISYEQYMQMIQQTGLGELTAKQLRELNIGKNIVNQMVSRELLSQWGDEVGLASSKNEIAEEVKTLPYFLDDRKQFDITRYKAILENNHLSPQQFEDRIAKDMLTRKAALSASWSPISNAEAKLSFIFKNTGTKISVAKFRPSNLKPFVTVSQADVKKFVNDTKNFNLLKNLYEQNKYQYVAPATKKVREVSAAYKNEEEKVKIQNELKQLKAVQNSADFLKAADKFVALNKEQRSSVDHGWLNAETMNFSENIKQSLTAGKKNQIIGPEITPEQILLYYVEDIMPAKNISFEQAKDELAENHLKDLDTRQLEKLALEWQEKVKKLVSSNNVNELKALEKKISLEWHDNALLNKSEQTILGSVVDSAQIQKIHSAQKGDVLTFKSLADLVIVKIQNNITEQDPSIVKKWETDAKEQHAALERQAGNEMMEQLINQLKKKARVSINEQLL